MSLGFTSFGELALSDIPVENQTIVQAGLSSNITLAEEGIFIVNAGDLAIILSGQSATTAAGNLETDFAILVELLGIDELTSTAGSVGIEANTVVDVFTNVTNSAINSPIITGWSRVGTFEDEEAEKDKWRDVDIAA